MSQEQDNCSNGSEKGSIDLEDYYDQTLINYQLDLSPDGERIAFVAQEFDEEEEDSVTSLFVAPTDGNEEPYRLTRASDATSPKWSPNGNKLGFIAQRDEDPELKVESEKEAEDNSEKGKEDLEEIEKENEKNGDEKNGDEENKGEEEAQVWVFNMKRGGDARQITTFEEGVESFDWGPNGERIVAASRDPNEEEKEYLESREDDGPVVTERLQHKQNGEGWLDTVSTYLFVVDLETREKTKLEDAYDAEKGTVWDMPPKWSPDGERIAFMSKRMENPDDTYVNDIYTISPDGSNLKKVTDSDMRVWVYNWSEDGKELAILSKNPENAHIPANIYVHSREDEDKLTNLTEDFDRTISGVPKWDDDSVVAPVGDEAKSVLYRFDSREEHEHIYGDGDKNVTWGFDIEDGTITMALTEPKARDIYTAELDKLGDKEPKRVTEYNQKIVEDHNMECEKVKYENSDGTEIEAIAYLPPEFDSERYPVIVDIHGGPITYDEPEYRFRNLYWTSEGYIVLNVNYRGSTSYGREFSETIRGDWGPRETDDIKSGIEHLIDKGWVDEDRVFVTGFSQGGINTVYFVTRTDMATAAAPEHGIYDFYSNFGTNDGHVWYENDFGLPWENPEKYRKVSSITDVGEINTPLLITAGENDWRCPPTQAEQLYVSVKKQGVPSKLVVYPNLPHARGGPEEVTHRLENITDWFKKHDPKIENEE